MQCSFVRRLMMAGAVAVLGALPALAVTVAAPGVTGHVTSISANVSITVDGKPYSIAPNSPAATSVRNVHVGDEVGLFLDGPAAKSTSHVINIEKQSNAQ